MKVSFAEASFKDKCEPTERSALTVVTNENVKMQAIYFHVLERKQICLTGEVLQFISVHRRPNHSGHNSANLNDISLK